MEWLINRRRMMFNKAVPPDRLSDNNKQVLRNQKKVMEEYLNILNLRTYENVDSFAITDLVIEPLKYERCLL